MEMASVLHAKVLDIVLILCLEQESTMNINVGFVAAVRNVGNVMALAELTNDTLYTLFPFAIHCYYNTNCIDKSLEVLRVKKFLFTELLKKEIG